MPAKLNFNLLGYRIVPAARSSSRSLVGIARPAGGGAGACRQRLAHHRPARPQRGCWPRRKQSSQRRGDGDLAWFERLQVQVTRLLARRGDPHPASVRHLAAKYVPAQRPPGADAVHADDGRRDLHCRLQRARDPARLHRRRSGNISCADVTLDFDQPYRLQRGRAGGACRWTGVTQVEGWQFASGELLDRGWQLSSKTSPCWRRLPKAQLVEPILVAGRWMRTDDVRKMAVSEGFAEVFPDLKPGDPSNMQIDGRDETTGRWSASSSLWTAKACWRTRRTNIFREINNLANRSYSYRIVTERHDRAYQDAKARGAGQVLARYRATKCARAEAGSASLDMAVESLDILVIFLLIMAILTAIVGSMGLTGTMGMNVLERTREIGIMRAIGADDRAVMRTVIAEGVVIGMISFGLAIILSIPFTYVLSYIVSLAVFQTPIDVVFTCMGYAIWLGLVLVLIRGCEHPARAQRGAADDP
ncbi:MAG: ABC transporter permease [Desulfobacterales bacterium]|nr:ABC transporter permease [Desulfobacterales bacterium]